MTNQTLTTDLCVHNIQPREECQPDQPANLLTCNKKQVGQLVGLTAPAAENPGSSSGIVGDRRSQKTGNKTCIF